MASVTLGVDNKLGRPIVIDDEARQRGLYVVGGTGTGKSTLLLNLIVQDLKNGHGMCVLDPHGDLIDDVLLRLPRKRERHVILLDAGDTENLFALNFFEPPQGDDPALAARTADQAVEIFKKVWGDVSWGPQLEDLLRNIAYLLLDNPGYTLAEVPAILRDADLREHLIQNVTNAAAREFWEEEYPTKPHDQRELSRSTLNKVRSFLLNPVLRGIVGARTSSVDFRAAMDSGQVVLVKLALGRVGEHIVNLLGSLIVAQIFNSALSRQDLRPEDRRLFSLYADEYFRFSTPYFAQLLTDARKFAIATTVAHQFRDQFEQSDLNRGATLGAANLVVFRLTAKDARELAGQFHTSPGETDFTNEMITEPVMREWQEDVWDPPHAQMEYKALGVELEELELELDVFCRAALLDDSNDTNIVRSRSNVFSATKALVDGLAATDGSNEQAQLRVYSLFNPSGYDAATRGVLESIAFLPGGNRVARQPGRAEYLLPPTLPSMFEHYLRHVEIEGKPLHAEHSPAAVSGSRDARRVIAQQLLDEVQPLLTTLKTKATYVFDPTVKPAAVHGVKQIEAFSSWQVAPFPEILDWFIARFSQLWERRHGIYEQRSVLWKTARSTVTKKAYAGYDLPVKSVSKNRWGEEIEVQRYRKKPVAGRTHSDVEAETANEIVFLPDRHALCRVKEGNRITEYRLLTLKPVEAMPTTAARRLLERIKGRSRAQFVEQASKPVAATSENTSTLDESHKTSRRVRVDSSQRPLPEGTSGT